MTILKCMMEDNTYGRVDKPQENDRADDGPDRFDRTLLEALSDDLVQTVAHAAQLRRESECDQLRTCYDNH